MNKKEAIEWVNKVKRANELHEEKERKRDEYVRKQLKKGINHPDFSNEYFEVGKEEEAEIEELAKEFENLDIEFGCQTICSDYCLDIDGFAYVLKFLFNIKD